MNSPRGAAGARPQPVIIIIVETVSFTGRSSASLPDGTILVPSSRQPFIDAARVLVNAGVDPDRVLESRRRGSKELSLRARLGTAARLTVDETKTVFAPWKPFSQSAVSTGRAHSLDPAGTVPDPSAALQSAHLAFSPRDSAKYSKGAPT